MMAHALDPVTDGILNRLKKGQEWLRNRQVELLDLPNFGIGHPKEAKFLEMLDVWDGLDFLVRQPGTSTLAWEGCVIGTRCDPESPVLCRSCEKKGRT